MFKKVFPGSPVIPMLRDSVFLNHLVDIVNAWRDGRLSPRPRSVAQPTDNNNVVSIKNQTGANLKAGEAVRLGEYLLNEKNPKLRWYEGNAIDATFSPRIAIAAEPIPDGKIGLAYVGGMCLVRYTGSAPSVGDGLGPKPSQATLAIGYPCFGTVEAVIDTTEKLVQCRLQPISTLLCKPTGAVSANTPTTSYKIYAGTPGSESDSGFTTVPSAVSRTAIASGKWCKATRINGLEMEPLQC
jgi:hypothetical protein